MPQSADELYGLHGPGGRGGMSADKLDAAAYRCVDRRKNLYHLTEMQLLFPPSDSVTDDFSLCPGAADSAAAESPGARPRTGHSQGTCP